MTEPQIKKHLTAEEHAMRRAEMARRRKNLSEKRNEEEKVTKTSFLFFFLSFCSFYHHTNCPNINFTFSFISPFPSIHSPPLTTAVNHV